MKNNQSNKIKSIPYFFSGFWFKDPPKDVSLDGYRIDNVIHYTDLVIGIYFGIVVAALAYFIFKYRASLGHKAEYDHGNSRKNVMFTGGLGLLVFFSVDAVIEKMAFKDLKEAFGMEVESIERADHISTQTEFLSFLLLKELLALTNELDEEKEICETAFIDFNQNHFSDWAKMFAGNLADKVDGGFYPVAGKFLQAFLIKEKS